MSGVYLQLPTRQRGHVRSEGAAPSAPLACHICLRYVESLDKSALSGRINPPTKAQATCHPEHSEGSGLGKEQNICLAGYFATLNMTQQLEIQGILGQTRPQRSDKHPTKAQATCHPEHSEGSGLGKEQNICLAGYFATLNMTQQLEIQGILGQTRP